MAFSIRLSKEEKLLAESYRRALFERIEDEYDVVVAEEAYQEYLENPKTYTHEDVKGLLDL